MIAQVDRDCSGEINCDEFYRTVSPHGVYMYLPFSSRSLSVPSFASTTLPFFRSLRDSSVMRMLQR